MREFREKTGKQYDFFFFILDPDETTLNWLRSNNSK